MSITRIIEIDGYGEIEISRASVASDVVTLDLSEIDFEGDHIIELFNREVDALVDTINEVQQSALEDEPEVYPDLEIPTVGVLSGVETIVRSFIQVARTMVIDYIKEDETKVRRVVSPHSINEVRDGGPFIKPKYVNGYDHTAQGFRNFRLSRIRGIAPAKEDYVPKS